MTLYGYGRHSTDKQGLTEAAQLARVTAYAKLIDESAKVEWLYDSAVSGSKRWFERPKGIALWALAQPGDHVIVAKLDRAFRRTVDGLVSLEMLASKGVFFHSVDQKIDTSTAMGKAMLSVVLAFNQLEREACSERTASALAVKRKLGLPTDGHAPIGWKKVGKKAQSRFLPCQEERDQVFEIVGLRAAGYSLDQVVDHFWKRRRPNGYRWNRNSVRAAEIAAERGFPKELPKSRLRSSAAHARPSP